MLKVLLFGILAQYICPQIQGVHMYTTININKEGKIGREDTAEKEDSEGRERRKVRIYCQLYTCPVVAEVGATSPFCSVTASCRMSTLSQKKYHK